MSNFKQLPTGIQTFAKLREDGDYYYVDKTPYLLELCKESAVFLSRPRRFGKSLTLSTLDALFSGEKHLFKGLYAEKHWDFATTYPVITLSFGAGNVKTEDKLGKVIRDQLARMERKFNTTLTAETSGGKLQELIEFCYRQNQQKVVVLIDEYDKPMLDSLTHGDIITVRDALREFYSAIKDSDKYLRFVMLTGVSQFSKMNLFSGLNNLKNITLLPKYSAICGYTQAELESVFTERLGDVNLPMMKKWYNGYNWGGESVYNPYDVLLFLDNKQFAPHWYQTGSPTFLIDFLVNNQFAISELQQQIADIGTLEQFDIDNTSPIALMFQTGYLTLASAETDFMGEVAYTLKYPNLEVQRCLNDSLLTRYLNSADVSIKMPRNQVYQNLKQRDFDALMVSLNALFAGIPHDWYRNNTIAHYEGYWSSVFYTFFAGLGFGITPEDTTNQGQIDVTLDFEEAIFLFEFKVIEKIDKDNGEAIKILPQGSAIRQLREKDYADKYRAKGLPIYQLGIEFSEKAKQIIHYDIEEVL